MNKESLKSAGKFAVGVIATLFVVALVKKFVLPKLPAGVQNMLGYVLP